MAKTKNKKVSTKKSVIAGILCLVIGLIIGFVGNILFSLPGSYKIPKPVAGSTVSAGSIDNSLINSSELSVHFLELGNKYTGDCILIKTGNTEILVDSGSKTSSIPYIEEYVDKYVTDGRLEYVVVTHAHEDHYAGFATNESTESLFDYYTEDGRSIGTIIKFAQTNKTASNLMQKNFERELSEAIVSGTKVFTALECYEGTTNQFGDTAQQNFVLENNARLQILNQKFYRDHATTENNYSVCFQIEQYGKRYLFTGDLEAEGEDSLLALNSIGKVELYKAGHHGSKTSSSKELMEVIQPNIVVVCCVAGSSEYTSKNENQFPTQAFVDNVTPYTSQIYVTSLCVDYAAGKFVSFNGTIVVCANSGTDSQVLCSNSTTVLQDTDWFKQNRKLPENAKKR